MTMTPQDIQSKQFHVRMRGFDMDEVDKFLEKIAEELLIVSLENKQILEKIETMEKELANYKNKEQAFQSAILSAQRISDEMQARSRQEAEDLVNDATKTADELENRTLKDVEELVEKSQQDAEELIAKAENDARQILEDSKTEHRQLTDDINNLIDLKSRVMSDMRQLLNNYLDHIEEGVPTGLNGLEPLPQEEELSPTFDSQPTSREEDPMVNAVFDNFKDHDLENLYEKIDLPEQTDEESLADPDEPATLDISDIEPLEFDEEEQTDAPAATVLDEEKEQLFSLDDPLDELEPSVSISEEDQSV